MSLKRGDIVLLPFPWTDLQYSKVRPALVVSDGSYNKCNNDAVFLFITTQEYKGRFDLRLEKTDPSFKNTGLRRSSTFRTAKLMSLEQALAKKRLGHADKQLLKQIEERLRLLFNF